MLGKTTKETGLHAKKKLKIKRFSEENQQAELLCSKERSYFVAGCGFDWCFLYYIQ